MHSCSKSTALPRWLQTAYTSKELRCLDEFGNFLYSRPADQPIRFSVYDPASRPEGFFYNVLLRQVTFRAEKDLLSTSNSSKSYLEECQLRGIINCEEDLRVS